MQSSYPLGPGYALEAFEKRGAVERVLAAFLGAAPPEFRRFEACECCGHSCLWTEVDDQACSICEWETGVFRPDDGLARARDLYLTSGVCFSPEDVSEWDGESPSQECDRHKRRVIEYLCRLYEERAMNGEAAFGALLRLEEMLLELPRRCGRMS